MGDRNPKAIAIRGTGAVTVGDGKAFLADVYRIHTEHVLTDFNLCARRRHADPR